MRKEQKIETYSVNSLYYIDIKCELERGWFVYTMQQVENRLVVTYQKEYK